MLLQDAFCQYIYCFLMVHSYLCVCFFTDGRKEGTNFSPEGTQEALITTYTVLLTLVCP